MLALEKVEIKDPHIQNNFDKIERALNSMSPVNLVSHRVTFQQSGTYKIRHSFKGTPTWLGITYQEGSGVMRALSMNERYIEVIVSLTDMNLIIEFLLGNIGVKTTEVTYE